MANRKNGKAPRHATDSEQVAKDFVRIYYGILNSHPNQLFQFYGDDSTVIASEFGTGSASACMETADSRERIRPLLKRVFQGVTAKIKTALPQTTVDGGLLLVVSGTLHKAETESNVADEYCFTQAIVLAPQKNGYYILNDTLHIMGSLADADAANRQNELKQAANCAGQQQFYPSLQHGHGFVPMTPRPKGNVTARGGHDISSSSDVDQTGLHENKSETDSDDSLEDAPKKVKPHAIKQHTMQTKQPRMYRPFQSVPAASSGPQSNGVPLHVRVGVPPPQPVPGHVKPAANSGEERAMPVPAGHGVFIARLPFGIQEDEVEKAFSLFGPVLNGSKGIQVRDGRNGCYAFVTFESSSSAQAAIEKGAIVQGKRVHVEQRYQRPEADPSYSLSVAPPPPPPGPPVAVRLASPLLMAPPPRAP